MFRFFFANYPWDLSINLALEMGVRMGEIEEMCASLKEAAFDNSANAGAYIVNCD